MLKAKEKLDKIEKERKTKEEEADRFKEKYKENVVYNITLFRNVTMEKSTQIDGQCYQRITQLQL